MLKLYQSSKRNVILKARDFLACVKKCTNVTISDILCVHEGLLVQMLLILKKEEVQMLLILKKKEVQMLSYSGKYSCILEEL